MSEEQIEEQVMEQTASEGDSSQAVEAEMEQKMVPLAALEAERRKRQESEAKATLYESYLLKAKQSEQVEEVEEDPTALVEKKYLNETTAQTKREIIEAVYQDTKPEAVQAINKYLNAILEKKPWLTKSIDDAMNRYARAYEIVQDYKHLVEPTPAVRSVQNNDGRKIVQNANKPRSPVEIGKSAQPSGSEYLKSIQGKKEFREYRQKVLRGET